MITPAEILASMNRPSKWDGWVPTFSRTGFRPFAPDPGQPVVEDIAHGLAHTFRYDIFDPTRPGTRQPIYVPYGTLGNPGSVDVTLTSAVARSMESGSIAGHKNRGNILVEVINGDAHGDAVGQVIRVPFVVSPGNTINEVVWVPTACRVLSIQAYIEQAAVTAGAYTLAVQHGPDAGLVNLLSAATFDLTTLVAQTITSVGLTATSANRNLTASRRIRFQVVSNNGDLAGAGLTFALRYGLR